MACELNPCKIFLNSEYGQLGPQWRYLPHPDFFLGDERSSCFGYSVTGH